MVEPTYKTIKLIEQRRQDLMRAAEAHRLRTHGRLERFDPGIGRRLVLRTADLLITFGLMLKRRYAIQSYDLRLEVK